MPNDYFVNPGDLVPGGLAKARDLNDRTNAVDAAFDKLPDPYSLGGGLKGFTEPVVVGEAVEDNHAVNRLFVETASAAALAAAQQALADTEQALADTQAQAQLALNRANAAQNSAIDTSNDLAAAQATEEAAEDEANRAQLERINAETATGQAQIFAESAEFWANQAGTINALGLDYKGPFDASTGEYPDGEERGDFYIVQTAGEIDEVQHNVQDWIVYDGALWHHYPYGQGGGEGGFETVTEYAGPIATSQFGAFTEIAGDRMVAQNLARQVYVADYARFAPGWVAGLTEIPEISALSLTLYGADKTWALFGSSSATFETDLIVAYNLDSGESEELHSSDYVAGDRFGCDADVDDGTLVVGAYSADTVGAAYVFKREGGAWVEKQKLAGSDASVGSIFGFKVAASAGTIAVSAREQDNGPGNANGAVYVFTESAGVWSEQQKIEDPEPTHNDDFGDFISLSGDYLAIGCFRRDPPSQSNSGKVYVFKREGGVWSLDATLGYGDDGSYFGYDLAIDRAGALIVGAYRETVGAPLEGAAYLYRSDGSGWVLESVLYTPDTDAESNVFFGSGTAIDSGRVLIGARGAGDTGKVYAYFYSGSPPFFLEAVGHYQSVDWSPDGGHLVLSGFNENAAPDIGVYSHSAGVFDRITPPEFTGPDLPLVRWNHDQSSLLIAGSHAPGGEENYPVIKVFNFAEGAFTEAADLSGVDPGSVIAAEWDDDGDSLAIVLSAYVGESDVYSVRVYNRGVGDAFTQLVDPITVAPGETISQIAWSPDGAGLAIFGSVGGSGSVRVLDRAADVFTPVGSFTGLPSETVTAGGWNHTGEFLAAAGESYDGVEDEFVADLTVFIRSGSTFTKVAGIAEFPGYDTAAVAIDLEWSHDGNLLAVMDDSIGEIRVYQRDSAFDPSDYSLNSTATPSHEGEALRLSELSWNPASSAPNYQLAYVGRSLQGVETFSVGGVHNVTFTPPA